MDTEILPRINRIVLTGFLQQQPELRHTPSGVSVASFRVRCGRWARDRRGVLRETVSFFTVVVWQDVAERICRDGSVGQGISVEGYLHSRSFMASSGERRTVVEVYAESAELVDARLDPGADRRGRSAGGDRNRGDEEHHPRDEKIDEDERTEDKPDSADAEPLNEDERIDS